MAEYAGVPVVNALTDDFHPCQLLADLLTVRERCGSLAGLTVAFIGDGACNMGNSWLLAGATAGMHVRIGAPEGYLPDAGDVRRGDGIGAADRRGAYSVTDPAEAVSGADVVVDRHLGLDGQGGRGGRAAAPRSRRTASRQSSSPGRSRTRSVLHCLPAYRGKEIAADVIDGPQSVGLGRGREPSACAEGDPQLPGRLDGRAMTESTLRPATSVPPRPRATSRSSTW